MGETISEDILFNDIFMLYNVLTVSVFSTCFHMRRIQRRNACMVVWSFTCKLTNDFVTPQRMMSRFLKLNI